MAEPAPRRVPTATVPSSPGDPRLAAALAIIWKHGLFPTIVAAAFIYLLWSLASGFARQVEANGRHLEALEQKVDQHQHAMERSDAATAAAIQRQSNRLRGICYGVTEDGSRARAFCDEE